MKSLKKIFITGYSGQLGFAIAQQLEKDPHLKVFCAIRKDQIKTKNLESVYFDFTEKDSIYSAINTIKPDLCINCAAYTDVEQAESEKDLATKVNVDGTKYLCDALKKIECPIIHFSTDHVYNTSHENLILESEETNPINHYGKTKLEGEKLITQSSIDYLIYRTSWVYSLRGKNFLTTMIQLFQKKEEISVVSDQWGAPTNTSTINALILHNIKDSKYDFLSYISKHKGIYHICDAGETNWAHFAKKIKDNVRSVDKKKFIIQNIHEIKSHQYPSKAKRPYNSRLSLKKTQETFCFYAKHWQKNLEMSIKDNLFKV